MNRLFPCLSLLLVLQISAASPRATPTFTLSDYLGRNWTNERVTFQLSAKDLAQAKEGRLLVASDNTITPYQLDTRDPLKPTLEFLVNLPAFTSDSFSFVKSSKSSSRQQTDLKIEETGDLIRITNAKTGIALNKHPEPGIGPIESVRLNSGRWVGSSRIMTTLIPLGYSARVVSQGPVSVEAICRQDFEGGGWWQLEFRLDANEPVVLVHESSALAGAATFSFSLSDNFNPTQLFYRYGDQVADGDIGKNATSSITPGEAFVLEPWLRWWIRTTEGHAFSVYEDTGNDMLTVGAAFAGEWVNPSIPRMQEPPRASLLKDDKSVHLDFTLQNGQREWMIAALPKDSGLSVLKDNNLLYSPSLPDQYVIKHGEFPLNLIKTYVLKLDDSKVEYPHVLITKADVADFRKGITDQTAYTNAIPRYLRDPNPLSQFNMEKPLMAFFATGDPALGRYLTEGSVAMMQDAVNVLFKQGHAPFGTAPHRTYVFGEAPLLADAVLSQVDLNPEIRHRLLAQLAFLGYSIARPDYWSPERGYAANPNMTTSVYGYLSAIACAIPTHPAAKAWLDAAMKQLKAQLDTWSDDNGGWLEAPHYAMVSYDQLLGTFLMTHNSGFNEYLYDPKMKKIINWLSKISTPSDSRFGGSRHLPPIGNTYIDEPTGEFGIVARLWKDKDPQFAREMQWMYHQQKSWPTPGIGGAYPAFAGYRSLLRDTSIPEEAPSWKSEMFPNVGVVLRNGYPTSRETQLLLLAGGFNGSRSHWDDDSGSFTLWGKGRIVADDFGYYGLAPAEDHNLLDAPTGKGNGIFIVKTFAPSKNFDYVDGSRDNWRRQIAFIKSDDSNGPNYFFVNDALHKPSAAVWRLWLTAERVDLRENGATVVGKEDVDTDIFFLQPAKSALSIESKSRTSGSGIRPDGSDGPTTTTQLGLIARPVGESIATIIYPRLKTERPPTVTPLADGKAARIETAAGVDYVFLSDESFGFDSEDIHFQGKAGAIRLSGSSVILALGEGARIAARGRELRANEVARTRYEK